MRPPIGEALWAALVESVRRVAVDVFFRNGHIEADWRRTDSMMAGRKRIQSQLYGVRLEGEVERRWVSGKPVMLLLDPKAY